MNVFRKKWIKVRNAKLNILILTKLMNILGEVLSWFKSPWLLVECYLYRKIAEAFFLT